jgi:hypothetical protein
MFLIIYSWAERSSTTRPGREWRSFQEAGRKLMNAGDPRVRHPLMLEVMLESLAQVKARPRLSQRARAGRKKRWRDATTKNRGVEAARRRYHVHRRTSIILGCGGRAEGTVRGERVRRRNSRAATKFDDGALERAEGTPAEAVRYLRSIRRNVDRAAEVLHFRHSEDDRPDRGRLSPWQVEVPDGGVHPLVALRGYAPNAPVGKVEGLHTIML